MGGFPSPGDCPDGSKTCRDNTGTKLARQATNRDAQALNAVRAQDNQKPEAPLPSVQIVSHTNDVAQIDRLLQQLNNAGLMFEAETRNPEGSFWAFRDGGKMDSAQMQIRKTLALLNSEQLAQLEHDYKAKHGVSLRDALLKNQYMSDGSKKCIEIYLSDQPQGGSHTYGIDKRTPAQQLQLTEIALKWHDFEMLSEALGGNSPAAQAARETFLKNNGMQRLGGSFSGVELDLARDVAQHGQISLASIARQDMAHWYHKNREHLEQSLINASDEDRLNYALGRELALNHRQPANPQEKAQLDFYTHLHDALKTSDRDLAIFEDKLLRKGSLISDILQGDLSRPTVMAKIEHMSAEELVRLKTDPTFKRDMHMALQTVFSGQDLTRADRWLDHLQNPEETEKSSQKGGKTPGKDADEFSVIRTMDDVIKSSRSDQLQERLVDEVMHMSPSDLQRYHDDANFKKRLDDMVNKALNDGPALDLIHRVLGRVASGSASPMVLDSTDRMLLCFVKMTAPGQSMHAIANAFRDDPTLLKRIQEPKTAEDKALRKDFELTLSLAVAQAYPNSDWSVTHFTYKEYESQFLSKGNLSPDLFVRFDEGQTRINDILGLKPEERQRLLNPHSQADKEWAQKALGSLNEGERKLVVNGLKQDGKLDAADQVEAFILRDGMSSIQLKSFLKDLQLHPQQLQEMKAGFATKYGGTLDKSLLGAVDSAERQVYEKLLSPPARSDGRQDYYDNLKQYGRATSGLADMLMAQGLWDGTRAGLQRELQGNTALRGEFARQFKDLPAEQQEQLIERYADALKAYRDSKGELTDRIVDTALIAATLCTGAVGGAAVFNVRFVMAAAMLGASFKTGATAAMQGQDFDGSFRNVAKLVLDGGFTGAFAAIPPAKLAAIFKVGDRAAAEAVATLSKNLATSGAEKAGANLLKEGFESEGTKLLTQLSRESFMSGKELTVKQMEAVAARLVNPSLAGAERDSAVKLISDALAKQYKVSGEAATRSLVRTIVQGGKEWGKESLVNAGIGSGASVAGQVLSAPLDYDASKSFGENMAALGDRIKSAAVSGAAGGVIFTTVFHVGRPIVGLVGGKALQARGKGSEDVKVKMKVENGQVTILGDKANPDVVVRKADGKLVTVPGGVTYKLSPGDEPVGIRRTAAQERKAVNGGGSRNEATGHAESYTRSPIASPETVPGLHESTGKVLDSWQPVRSNFVGYDETAKAAYREWNLINQEAGQKLLKDLKIPMERWSDEAFVRSRLPADKPEYGEFYDRYMQVDRKMAALEAQGAQLKAQRLQQLADAVNAKLPPGVPKAQFDTESYGNDAGGGYVQGTGKIYLDNEDVSDPSFHRDRLPNTIAHELVHLEQDSLLIRMYADQAGVKGLGTQAQREAIMQTYERNFGSRPTDDYLDRVLQARQAIGDQPLTPEQLDRARKLEQSWKNAPDIITLNRDLRIQRNQFDAIKRYRTTYDIIADINEGHASDLGPVMNRLLPLDVLNEMIKAQMDIAAGRMSRSDWNEAKYRKILYDAMDGETKSLHQKYDDAHRSYRDSYHEREAYATGALYDSPGSGQSTGNGGAQGSQDQSGKGGEQKPPATDGGDKKNSAQPGGNKPGADASNAKRPAGPTLDDIKTIPPTAGGLRRYLRDLKLTTDDFGPGKVIADVGAGLQQNLAKDVNASHLGAKVISVDPRLGLSEADDLMLYHEDDRPTRIEARKHPQPDSVAALAHELPFADGSLDAVYALRSTSLYQSDASEIRATLSEFVRVLKEGGVAKVYPISDRMYPVYKQILDSMHVKYDFQLGTPEPGQGHPDRLLIIRKTAEAGALKSEAGPRQVEPPRGTREIDPPGGGTNHLQPGNHAESDPELGAKINAEQARSIVESKPVHQMDEDEIAGVMNNWKALSEHDQEAFLAQFNGLDAKHSGDPTQDTSNKKYVLGRLSEYGTESVPASMRQWFEEQKFLNDLNLVDVSQAVESQMGRQSRQWAQALRTATDKLEPAEKLVADRLALNKKLDALVGEDLKAFAKELKLNIHDSRDQVELRKHIGNNEHLQDELQQYQRSRKPLEADIAKMQQRLDTYRSSLQNVINDQAKQLGIPAPNLTFVDDLPNANGQFLDRSNTITLRTARLAEPGGAAQTIAHELTHAEQYALVIRNIAEEMGLPRSPNNEQLQALRQAISRRLNGDYPRVSESYFKQVLEQQKEPLTPEEKTRAKRLEESFKDLKEQGQYGSERTLLIQKALDRAQRLLQIKDSWGILKFDFEKLKPILFNGQPVPQDIAKLVDATEHGDKAAQAQLYGILGRYIDSASIQLANKKFGTYRARLHEQEAAAVSKAVSMAESPDRETRARLDKQLDQSK